MTSGIKSLSTFPSIDDLPIDEASIADSLQSAIVKEVICFCLGPEGTNIEQAARRWLCKNRITKKSRIVLCDTPEICLDEAEVISDRGVVAVYWTCAVFSRESEFFFTNPDALPFAFQEAMRLDEMQLAVSPNQYHLVIDGEFPANWKIASHPSPQHLVKPLKREIVLVESNAVAAVVCERGDVQLCITTETARRLHNLHKLHSFGSPLMIFFGGLTQHGAKIIRRAFRSIKK